MREIVIVNTVLVQDGTAIFTWSRKPHLKVLAFCSGTIFFSCLKALVIGPAKAIELAGPVC